MKENVQISAENALFFILQQELGGRPCPAACFDSRIREPLLELAQKHDLAHIAANACINAGILGQDEASEAYRKAFMLAFYKSQQQSHALEQVSRAFDKLPIPYIPLKGSVIRRFYPQSWMRSSCDIDILIKPSDSRKAIDCLLELGYQLQRDTSSHDYSLFSPEGVHLELHFSLMQEEGLEKANPLLEKAWEYVLSNCRELTGEMFLLYHVAHMAKHFIMGGCGIRPFLDLWVLRGKMAVDIPRLESMLREAGLLEFYRAVNETVDVWFENKPHSHTTAGIQEYILTGGVYGTWANAFAVRAAGGESRLKSFGRLMFMSRANLEYMYPRLERYPLLMPYYQVKRWFGFFSKTRRTHLKRLTDTRGSVTKTQAGSTADLLAKLGLEQSRK